jgi:hypothetical protein
MQIPLYRSHWIRACHFGIGDKVGATVTNRTRSDSLAHEVRDILGRSHSPARHKGLEDIDELNEYSLEKGRKLEEQCRVSSALAAWTGLLPLER